MSLLLESSIYHSLEEICLNSNESFSGLGIVFYENLDDLPFISLHKMSLSLEMQSLNFIKIMQEISKKTSIFHDGFHFFDINLCRITHISQYISPILSGVNEEKINNILPCGAREMTAFLTSYIKGVYCVGLISVNKKIKIFKDGEIVYSKDIL
ncbi:hypothetical protein VXG46_002057 [Acinetobacter baumannii]|uniref:Uncharacterized protein n=1 Tax=Acinetobacter baumannii TaxID=470 RepID=A0A505MJB9_ACIBA|nr:hypothetical protein [Acinetobacter baumannii]EJB8496091.1 hypothetical protein [Acinetobacter baumannii]ELB0344268.1 hypothetical protein [Acinetobacter baumannii]EMC7951476.1 hypothetical protein [Acinetobacter baumannii]EMD9692896.1 hypothetical protein [Acinetobacter baumannii]KCY22421.1 hypothetical protein J635_2096 [Acinetobacter baumannii 233846]